MKRSVLIYLPDLARAQLVGQVLDSAGLMVCVTPNQHAFEAEMAKEEHQVAVIDLPECKPGSLNQTLDQISDLNNLGRIVLYTGVAEPRLLGHENSDIPKSIAYIVQQKSDAIACLVEAICINESKSVPVRLRQHLIADSPLTQLSRSQLHVLRCISSGKSNSEIADLRQTSVRAVENLAKRTIQSMGIQHKSMSAAKILATRAYFEAAGLMLPPELPD